MMDWYVTQYLYPLAMDKFCKTMFPNVGVLSLSTLESYDLKKLYHFFDGQGIYLTVEMITKNNWVFNITTEKGILCLTGNTQCSSRQEIEKEGFSECFAVLNRILSKC